MHSRYPRNKRLMEKVHSPTLATRSVEANHKVLGYGRRVNDRLDGDGRVGRPRAHWVWLGVQVVDLHRADGIIPEGVARV